MAIDISIFIENKKDVIQKALAIIEISKDDVQLKYFFKKYDISDELLSETLSLFENQMNGKISFKDYENLSITNYKKFI